VQSSEEGDSLGQKSRYSRKRLVLTPDFSEILRPLPKVVKTTRVEAFRAVIFKGLDELACLPLKPAYPRIA
jgi:hypothetical protein